MGSLQNGLSPETPKDGTSLALGVQRVLPALHYKAKVFGIGFHKTGTTSLELALRILRYRVCGAQPQMAGALARGDLSGLWPLVETWTAFRDNPWPLVFRELDERYPGAKFILTTRAPENWLRSVLNHFGDRPSAMRELIYGYGSPVGNESAYIARYTEHHEAVRRHFARFPGRLLECSWEEGHGWKELCPFLDQKEPALSFPHANSRDSLRQ